MDELNNAAEKPSKLNDENRPLADILRPKKLDEVIGQAHLLGEQGSLRRMVDVGRLNSMIFWGPPGTGKTSVARLLAIDSGYHFEQISAIFSGVADLKKLFASAQEAKMQGRKTLLFVDEIHRFNKGQQDSFLPVLEDGTIILVGATTENPSFELNSALLSRVQVMVFESLNKADLEALLLRAEKYYNIRLPLTLEATQMLISLADGDGRVLLGFAQEIFLNIFNDEILDEKTLQELLQRKAPIYDKGQDGHYNLISALHKSVRGSDPDAALYYFSRMLDAGEDPMFLARRIIRMAVEDISLADPNALVQTIAAKDAYQMLGTPEGELALAQAVVYLATAPKSNAMYKAFSASTKLAKKSGAPMPPKVILNAPTKLMGDEGYGVGYIYDHDTKEGFSGQNYFPDKIGRQKFYSPVERGFERDIKKRLNYFNSLRAKKKT